jgi:hypothetical protein
VHGCRLWNRWRRCVKRRSQETGDRTHVRTHAIWYRAPEPRSCLPCREREESHTR